MNHACHGWQSGSALTNSSQFPMFMHQAKAMEMNRHGLDTTIITPTTSPGGG
jgi:hypothetical protein